MQSELVTIKNAGIAAYRSLFAGRITRTTFVIRVAILVATVWIVLAPLGTFLAPSSKTLKDIYLALALALVAVCVAGFASAYVKRLHDIGLQGYWAILFILALPYLIIQVSDVYKNYRFLQDRTADAYAIDDVIFPIIIALPLLIAMWRGQKDENRFGPAPDPVEHVATSKFNIVAVFGAAALLIPVSIYAGLFQSSVWVGREGITSIPAMKSNVPGTLFMQCGNVKGVGAGSGKGQASGVFRDGYEGNVFDFVLTPTGQIDIAMAGERGGSSYIADGFRIIPYGLKLANDGSGYVNLQGLDRFMLVAIGDQGGPGAAINYTTFTFSRNEDSFPEYHMVMTAALSSSATASPIFPEARGKLMLGDCYGR